MVRVTVCTGRTPICNDRDRIFKDMISVRDGNVLAVMIIPLSVMIRHLSVLITPDGVAE